MSRRATGGATCLNAGIAVSAMSTSSMRRLIGKAARTLSSKPGCLFIRLTRLLPSLLLRLDSLVASLLDYVRFGQRVRTSPGFIGSNRFLFERFSDELPLDSGGPEYANDLIVLPVAIGVTLW